MTAPKIDTQAPERVWISPEHDGENDYGGFWIKAKVAPSVEYERRDLADARAAAAAQAMREACIRQIKLTAHEADMFNDEHGKQLCARTIAGIEATTTLDPATALDRLIAEQVREAVEADIRGAITAALDGVHVEDGSLAAFNSTVDRIVNAIAARGSKEGQS